MRFQNIKVTDAGVVLDRLDKQPDGSTLTQEFDNPSRPLPPFTAAMQAFSGYAVDLIGAPQWHEEVKVSSIHLSEEPKTSRRGLIVTIVRKIDRAKNRTIVINTPLMHAPVDDQEGTNPGTYPKEVADMIATVEREATKYWDGEREQGEIFTKASTDATTGDSAETVAPARGRSGKPKDFIKGVGPIDNPDKTVAPTDEAIRQLMLAADRDVPIDAIAHWNSTDRDQAQRWAQAKMNKVLGQKVAAKDLVEPKCVKANATLPLKATEGDEDDNWDQPNPLAGKKSAVQPVVRGD